MRLLIIKGRAQHILGPALPFGKFHKGLRLLDFALGRNLLVLHRFFSINKKIIYALKKTRGFPSTTLTEMFSSFLYNFIPTSTFPFSNQVQKPN